MLPGLVFDVVHQACIKNKAADASWQVETGGADTTELEDELPEMML